MLKLRRLNLDTSWEIHWGKFCLMLDPWLIGSEVDYFSWFNEQWHIKEPVPIDKLKDPDAILISQSYSDHCHETTLHKMDHEVPILASPKAYKRLIKTFKKSRLIKLPLLSKEGWMKWGDFEIASLDPGNKMDPVYYAHAIKRDDEVIFYASHGFDLNENQLKILEEYYTKLMIVSFSEIKLPSILGGRVNPGMKNVHQLVDQLHPEYVLNTHDEPKKAKGFVMKLAQCTYPDFESISFANSSFINIDNYAFNMIT